METNQQAAVRLVGAVEVLMAQESAMVAAGRRKGVVEIMRRAAPLFQRLANLGMVALDADLRQRMSKVAETRRRTRHFLETQMNQVAEEIVRVKSAQQRLRRIAPAYVSAYGSQRVGGRLVGMS